jgi:iron-sulfur cluster repair protein YtfE (RIC family)
MTEHKTMNTIIHAAFRRDLVRFDAALATFAGGSTDRADQLKRAWDNFAYQLRHHHEDEETIFWPVLRELGASDALAGDLEGEHEEMLTALEGAEQAMTAFHADPTDRDTDAARSAVTRLSEVLLAHLAHEERDMEPLSAANHKTPQLKRAQRVVRQAHKGNTGTLFAWLQDGADADARAGLRREVPPPVLFTISRVGGRHYNRHIAPIWS